MRVGRIWRRVCFDLPDPTAQPFLHCRETREHGQKASIGSARQSVYVCACVFLTVCV